MREIKETINEKPFFSNILGMYFGKKRIVTLDIETTGLSSVKNKVILIGFVLLAGEKKQVLQLFADSRDEEAAILRRCIDVLNSCDVIITYNGASFDIPFLRKRMEVHGIQGIEVFDRVYHIDMLKIIRKYSELKSLLPDLKQKTVEHYFGFSDNRKDEISGADSVRLYNRYCSLTKGLQPAAHAERESAAGNKAVTAADPDIVCGSESTIAQKPELSQEAKSALTQILLHNRDDILRLSELISISRQLDMHKIMFYEGWPGVRNIVFENNSIRTYGEHPLMIPLERISGYYIADLISLNADEPELKRLPGYESGYLILSSENGINYLETNALINIKTQAAAGLSNSCYKPITF